MDQSSRIWLLLFASRRTGFRLSSAPQRLQLHLNPFAPLRSPTASGCPSRVWRGRRSWSSWRFLIPATSSRIRCEARERRTRTGGDLTSNEQGGRGPGAWNPFTSSSNVILSCDRSTAQIGGGECWCCMATCHAPCCRRPSWGRHSGSRIHERGAPDPAQGPADEQVGSLPLRIDL